MGPFWRIKSLLQEITLKIQATLLLGRRKDERTRWKIAKSREFAQAIKINLCQKVEVVLWPAEMDEIKLFQDQGCLQSVYKHQNGELEDPSRCYIGIKEEKLFIVLKLKKLK